MKPNPFFSVIIPTYNRAKLLKIAIDSVLSQSFTDFELIIIDDGSTDGTAHLVDEYSQRTPKTKHRKPKLSYIHQPHQGVASARNRGVKEAKGEFICFLDSDDRFRKDKLEITYKYIKKYPRCNVFHTEEIWYRNGGLLSQKAHHKKPSGDVFRNVVKLCCVGISTAAIKRELFDQIGIFDEKLPACEDYDFWLRVSSKFPILLIPQYLTIKEGGQSDQQSKKYPAMDRFRIYALKKILEQGELTKENYRIAYRELQKKCNIYIKGAKKRGKLDEVSSCQKLVDALKLPPALTLGGIPPRRSRRRD
jgi:glycosyltransferase involved in cell wall biosynthesis